MAERKHNKHLQEKEFTLIKTLLDVGLTVTKIKEISGRSYSTVNWVNQSSDFGDYRKNLTEWWTKYKIKSKTKDEKKTVEVGETPTKKEMDESNSIVTLLKTLEHNQQMMIDLHKDEVALLQELRGKKFFWQK